MSKLLVYCPINVAPRIIYIYIHTHTHTHTHTHHITSYKLRPKKTPNTTAQKIICNSKNKILQSIEANVKGGRTGEKGRGERGRGTLRIRYPTGGDRRVESKETSTRFTPRYVPSSEPL